MIKIAQVVVVLAYRTFTLNSSQLIRNAWLEAPTRKSSEL